MGTLSARLPNPQLKAGMRKPESLSSWVWVAHSPPLCFVGAGQTPPGSEGEGGESFVTVRGGWWCLLEPSGEKVIRSRGRAGWAGL